MSYGSQATAGVVLGTPLAFVIAGIYAELGPADPATNFMAALYLSIPLWLAVMVWALKRTHALSAWGGLLLADAAMAVLVVALRLYSNQAAP